jgi:hypothetical protein
MTRAESGAAHPSMPPTRETRGAETPRGCARQPRLSTLGPPRERLMSRPGQAGKTMVSDAGVIVGGP